MEEVLAGTQLGVQLGESGSTMKWKIKTLKSKKLLPENIPAVAGQQNQAKTVNTVRNAVNQLYL